jgi:GNAT superfamily N-acetyltransferase
MRRGDASVGAIVLKHITGDEIELCRDLCDELMAYQKSKAVMLPEVFDGMNFDTRLKASHANSPVNQLTVAMDGDDPAGYVFSSVEHVTQGDKSAIPPWAQTIRADNMMGFYPPWNNLPDRVGCLNHLYIRGRYRGSGLGTRLLDSAMAWFGSLDGIGLIFVYISNGNQAALDFYLKHGFTYSHDVFGGFIQAAYKRM